jgi:hypothetical protein
MHTENREMLPKTPLPGVVLEQRVSCGRRNCGCAHGELHGPYFYRFWREGGRLKKAYVKRSELEEVRSRCDARRQRRRALQARWEEWRQLRAAVRDLEKP